MGWKQDMERSVRAIVTRLELALSAGEQQLSGLRHDVARLTSDLSALEAKVGDSKCCEPQPGDRIRLRDVPVWRWCEMDWGTPNKCFANDGVTQVMRSDAGQIWFSLCDRSGQQFVTLLPEDYEPNGKAESKPPTLYTVTVSRQGNMLRIVAEYDTGSRVIDPSDARTKIDHDALQKAVERV